MDDHEQESFPCYLIVLDIRLHAVVCQVAFPSTPNHTNSYHAPQFGSAVLVTVILTTNKGMKARKVNSSDFNGESQAEFPSLEYIAEESRSTHIQAHRRHLITKTFFSNLHSNSRNEALRLPARLHAQETHLRRQNSACGRFLDSMEPHSHARIGPVVW